MINTDSIDGAFYYPPSAWSYLYPYAGTREFRNVTVALGTPSVGSGGVFWLQDYGDPTVASSILSAANGVVYFVDTYGPYFPTLLSPDVSWSDNHVGTGPYAQVSNHGLFDPTGNNGNISADPMFVAYSDDGNWTNDNLCLAAGSPGIDAGDPDPAYNDDDGTRNDMGAFGGPGAPSCAYMMDADGDGYAPIMGDCDDGSMGVFPWAPETACDGVDSDCDGLDGGEPCGDDDDSAGDDDVGDDDSAGDDDVGDDDSAGDDDVGDDDSAGDDDVGDDDVGDDDSSADDDSGDDDLGDDDSAADDDEAGDDDQVNDDVDCAWECSSGSSGPKRGAVALALVLCLAGLSRRAPGRR